jgi:uncharacterized damage-inducible protein DinB
MASGLRPSLMIDCALSYRTLLSYTAGEQGRWHDWFITNPAAFELPFADGVMSTIGGLVFHIFAVERRYAERLLETRVSTFEEMLVTEIEPVFALGDDARAQLERYLFSATPEDMKKVLTFKTLTAGTVSASKAKIASNVFLHGIRHWGQIATALRQAGFPAQWGHDYLLSSVD